MASSASSFGPRRGRRVQQEGRNVVIWDSNDRQSLNVQAASGHALTQRATAQLAVAVDSLNMFPKTVVVTDADIVRLGKQKTLAFAITMPIAAVAILSWFMLTPQLQSFTVPNPTYAQYTSAMQYNPTCPCSKEDIVVGDVATFRSPDAANVSTNFCKPIFGMYNFCVADPANGTCLTSDASSLLVASFIGPMYSICSYIDGGIADVQVNVMSSPLGSVVETPFSFDSNIKLMTLGEVEKLTLLLTSISIALSSSGWAGLTSSFLDPSYGALARNPPNCTCFSSASTYNTTPAAAVRGNGLCHYQIAFDYRPNITLDWGCVGSENLIDFPLELLRTRTTFDILGMQPPFDELMNFYVSPNSTTFMNAVDDVQGCLYEGVAARSSIAPGVMTYSHENYFTTCAPYECSYTYKAVPPTVTGFTLAFGKKQRLFLFLCICQQSPLLLHCRCFERATVPSHAVNRPWL
jgi:hypothetical protein